MQARKLQIGEDELWVLSYYRASELAGALLFGRLARRTSDDDLRVYLTEHFAQEAQHSWLWTKTIRACGGTPLPITETYQSVYGREIGLPATMAEVLLLTEVFEERIRQQFARHARRKNLHPRVRSTLQRMIADEEGHVGWITQQLKDYERAGTIDVASLRKKYKKIDRKIYSEVRAHETALWNYLGSKSSARSGERA